MSSSTRKGVFDTFLKKEIKLGEDKLGFDSTGATFLCYADKHRYQEEPEKTAAIL